MTGLWRAAPFVFLILWSGGYGFAKLGLQFAEPMTLLALRYGLAVAVLVPLALMLRPQWPTGARHWAAVAITGFLIQGVYFGLAYLAMKQGMNAGTTAIIMALQPALVAAAAPLIGGKRGGALLWLGLVIGFCGVILAVLSEGALGPSPLGAALLALGALAGISGATLFEKAQGRKTHPVTGGLVQYAVGFICVAPIAMATETMVIDWQPGLVMALVWLVLGNSLISISLYMAMLARGDATRISALMYLVPPLAMALAWALLGEPLRHLALVGLALSALGVYIVTRQTR